MSRIVVILAPGFEDLEAVTVVNILRRAKLQVITAGTKAGPITGSRGTTVIPDCELESVYHELVDAIVLPGGLPGADNLNSDVRVHSMLALNANAKRFIAAICAAPKVLAKAGLLTNKNATCFPGSYSAQEGENINWTSAAVVVDENIVTSRGPGTAMDFALTLVSLLAGEAVRQQVESSLVR